MRTAAMGTMLLGAIAATAAHGEVRIVDTSEALLRVTSILSARLGPSDSAARFARGSRFQIGQMSLIGAATGMASSPGMTMLPARIWRGRLHGFGAADQAGLSGGAVRARAVGFNGLQSERHVSGFLASELHYGIALNRDDLLTADLSAVSQRMPPLPVIGRQKSIHVRSLYLGAALTHARRLTLSGGWYRIASSGLSPLTYAVERAAGMTAAGQGMRLGGEWRLAPAEAAQSPRIGFEMRDGDTRSERLFAADAGNMRERRLMVRFTEPF